MLATRPTAKTRPRAQAAALIRAGPWEGAWAGAGDWFGSGEMPAMGTGTDNLRMTVGDRKEWLLTLGTDLVALEVEPSVVEAGRSLHYHVDIDRQLKAGVASAGQVNQEGLDLLRHQTLVWNAQRGCTQCVLVVGVFDADCVAQLPVG